MSINVLQDVNQEEKEKITPFVNNGANVKTEFQLREWTKGIPSADRGDQYRIWIDSIFWEEDGI